MRYNVCAMFSFVYKNIDFAHKLDKARLHTEDYCKHLHYFNEILFFIEGDVRYTVDGETRKLNSGDLVFIQSGKYHFADVNGDIRYERYVLKFPNELLPCFIVEKMTEYGAFFGNAAKYLMLFKQLDSYYGNYDGEETYSLFVCELTKLIIMLFKHPSCSPKFRDNVIAEMTEYIDGNIRSVITLDTLSEHFHFSKSYIVNEFRRYMKIPVMRYIKIKKMIAAHQLILGGEKKTEVAEMLGFENYSTFYRQYKKFMSEYLAGSHSDD